MNRINFVNDSSPYLSAENLNQMQNNIETEINNKFQHGYTGSQLSANDINEIKTRLTSSEFPHGVYFLNININGAINGLIVQKANNNYLSFIQFNYATTATHYKYFNGTWTETSLG